MAKASLYFTNQLIFELDWLNQYKIRIGPVLPANKNQISQSIKNLSSETIRNRFMGSKKEFSEKELEYLTNLDGWNHFALGIEERENPRRGIAIARLVRSSIDPKEAEVAITIIDEYQNKKLGTLLMRMITLAACERDLNRLSFTFLPQNEGIIKLIHALGPVRTGNHAMDFVQMYVDLKNVDIEKIKSQLAPHLPSIETFHSKI